MVAARLIALKLADEVALITADKPLGRPGVVALDPEARAALLDGSRYRAVETLDYGPDTMRLWQRADGSGGVIASLARDRQRFSGLPLFFNKTHLEMLAATAVAVSRRRGAIVSEHCCGRSRQ